MAVRSVLVVDDSHPDRVNLEKILSAQNFVVTSVANGREAVERCRQARPDVILMDVNMPEMDGFAAVRELRRESATKDIPVVFVTSKDQKADRVWAQMQGARGYVTKPYSADQILDQLRQL